MSARNHNWYTLNGTRRWPIDDAATGEADDGADLKNDVLVDAAVRVPADLCSLVAVSSVTVTKSLVSVTLVGAAAHPAAPVGVSVGSPEFVPVGVVSARKPLVPGRPYPVQPLADGVGGWVVFGEGVEKSVRHRFSTPEQAVLAPRACRFYRRLPVPTIGKQFTAATLTGVVLIKGGTDVEVVAATRRIGDLDRDAIVVRLKSNTPRNLFDLYRGPCGGRPESRTCDREGVEYINTVGPDCQGDIRIEFPDPLRPSYYPGGVALDYPYGLIDACTRNDRLPAPDGKLPNEYEDECKPESSAGDPDANARPPEPKWFAGTTDPYPAGISSEAIVAPGLPATVTWDQATYEGFIRAVGAWSFTSLDSPGEPPYRVVTVVPVTVYDAVPVVREVSLGSGSSSFSSSSSEVPRESSSSIVAETAGPAWALLSEGVGDRNVILWEHSAATGSVGLKVTADLWLRAGAGTAGVLLNYRPSAVAPGYRYWAAELSRVSNRFQIRHWNGMAWVNLAAAGPVRIAEGEWYRVEFSAEAVAPGTVRLVARAVVVATGATLATITTDVADYGTGDGYLGLVADRTSAAYSYLRVEAYP